MSNIAFVTGATGCVGTQLVSQLCDNSWEVVALILPAETNPWNGSKTVRTVTGDVNNLRPEDIPEQAVIFHLAAKVHTVPKTAKEKNDFFFVNYNGTANVARCAAARHAKGFVFVSTLAVYGQRVQSPHCDENAETLPVSTYGQSKLKAEQSLRENLAGKVPFVILRPCVVYGPGDKGNFTSLVNWIVNRRLPWFLVNRGKARKNTLYVRDLAAVLVYFGEHVRRNDGQIFNIASPESLTMYEIIKIIAEAADVDIKMINLPRWLLKPAVLLGDVVGWVLRREFFLSSRKLEVLTSDTLVDTNKLLAELRGRITFLLFREGVTSLLKER